MSTTENPRRALFIEYAKKTGVDHTLHEEWNKFDGFLSLHEEDVSRLKKDRDDLIAAAVKLGHGAQSNHECDLCMLIVKFRENAHG